MGGGHLTGFYLNPPPHLSTSTWVTSVSVCVFVQDGTPKKIVAPPPLQQSEKPQTPESTIPISRHSIERCNGRSGESTGYNKNIGVVKKYT